MVCFIKIKMHAVEKLLIFYLPSLRIKFSRLQRQKNDVRSDPRST